MFYIGIDPGASGGMAGISITTGELSFTQSLGALRDCELWEFVSRYSPRSDFHPLVVIEKVGGYMPGGRGNIGSAMFSFGMSYGKIWMALIAAGFRPGKNLREVVPRAWQGALGLILPRKRGEPKESKDVHKKALLGYARDVFSAPLARVGKITLATADAVLLALYCQRLQEGCMKHTPNFVGGLK